VEGEEGGGLDAAPWYGFDETHWKRSQSLILCFVDTGEPVMLPFRMSAYVLTNLVVTAGMLTPGLSVSNCQLPKLAGDNPNSVLF
jgi:hypothetical protein